MANLNETDEWPSGVYQWEEDDPVIGGPAGIDNVPTRQLASRGRFQRLRNITPWDAAFAYPANVAYVSYAGSTWKSVAESTGVVPGTDSAKWTRWGYTEAEMDAQLDGQMADHLGAADPHAQYALWEALRQVIAGTGAVPDRNAPSQLLAALRGNGLLYGLDTGAANAMVVNYTPAIPALVDGMALWVKAKATNTGATTLNVNGLGAIAVTGAAHLALQAGEIIANGRCHLIYSATLNAFVLIECTGGTLQIAPGTQGNHAVNRNQFLFGAAASGFKLPQGTSMLAGSGVTSSSGDAVINFATPFPTACTAVLVVPTWSVAATFYGANTNAISATGFSLHVYPAGSPASSAGVTGFQWIALGS